MELIYQKIYDFLENHKEGVSIVELGKELNMKRSTLVYHLQVLKAEGFIKTERIKKGKKGQPTIIKAVPEVVNRHLKNYEKKLLNDPISKDILKELSKEKITINKLLGKFNNAHASEVITLLEVYGYIKSSCEITFKGREFLKEKK